ncbi:hypothetical protein ACWCP6_29575 [Streptomyces sp. NPDC002004]
MTTVEFRPTHVVPQGGMQAWAAPDTSRPTVPLDPLLPVRLVDRKGDWALILCANDWSAWVDSRLLVPVPQDPPLPGAPPEHTADPLPLLTRVEEALGHYRSATEDLMYGQADGETFHRRTQGLRVGMVVDGESLWLYDAEHDRWLYCNGTRLTPYAAPHEPSAAEGGAAAGEAGASAGEGGTGAGDEPGPPGAAPRDPTRVVDVPRSGPEGEQPPPEAAGP